MATHTGSNYNKFLAHISDQIQPCIAADTDVQSQNVHVTQIWTWLHIHFNNTALFHLKEEESTGMYVYTRMHTRIYKCTEGILDPHTEIPTVCTYVYTEGIAVLHI